MKLPQGCLLVLCLLFFVLRAQSQSYHALTGSAYAGVTAMYTNPASTVNSVYKWDVTLFAAQATISNGAFVLQNNSLLNTNTNGFFLNSGLQSRHFNADIDANLLNLRFAIDSKSAFAFGFRLRANAQANGQPFYYNDTISSMKGFLHANNTVNFLDASLSHAAWAEFDMNYARNIFQSNTSSFSAGITLKYMRGLSGMYADVAHVNYIEQKANGSDDFILKQGGITAMYSDTYLETAGGNQVSNFIKKALPSFGLDIGAEYMLKDAGNVDDDIVAGTNYDWKIGLSIMDIGHNKFTPIDGSLSANTPVANVTDSVITKALSSVKNIRDFRDTLHVIFTNVTALQKKFAISLPTRVVLSVDRNIGSGFFVNAEASLNFYSAANVGMHTTEINLLTLTPRWETAAWGIYLPVQYNNEGQLWVGAAIKLGPLLMGVHNLDFVNWFKTGTQTYNGGGYIMLSVHPFPHKERVADKNECPKI